MKEKLTVLIIIFIFTLSCPVHSWAERDIIAVQSMRVQPYEEAMNGFKSACSSTVKRMILSELKGENIAGRINDIGPSLVLAIGPDALSKVKTIQDIPIVYLMLLNPSSVLSGEKNITGISMNLPPLKQFRALLDAMPGIKTVGLLYNPEKTGDLVEKTKEAAEELGLTLIAKQVYNAKTVPSVMQGMKGRIDVFMMLPDVTVVTPETVEYMLLFSIEHKIPILTFSEKYVEMGALMSIGIDAFDLGMQAGEMAGNILAGKRTTGPRQIEARKAVISINLKAARKLGILLDEKIIQKAVIIN